MLLQKLFCCGTCSVGVDFNSLGFGQSDLATTANTITNKVQLYTANIRIGEIIKLNKTDKLPSLEVAVEMENDKIYPETQFLYLHDTQQDLDEISDSLKYKVEKLDWAENIGKAYILLDFDKSKKYKLYFMQWQTTEGKKHKPKRSSLSGNGGLIQPENRSAFFRYEILGASPAFSVQAQGTGNQFGEDKKVDGLLKGLETMTSPSVPTLGNTPTQDMQNYLKRNHKTLSMDAGNNEEGEEDNSNGDQVIQQFSQQYSVNNSLLMNDKVFEYGSYSTQKPQTQEKNKILQNYNPMTRTYFKCSVYSPSNRLFTVDEVNSNISGDQQRSSQLGKIKYQSKTRLDNAGKKSAYTSHQNSFQEEQKKFIQMKNSESEVSIGVSSRQSNQHNVTDSDAESSVSSGVCVSELEKGDHSMVSNRKLSKASNSRTSIIKNGQLINCQDDSFHSAVSHQSQKKDKENYNTTSGLRISAPLKNIGMNSQPNNRWFNKKNSAQPSNQNSNIKERQKSEESMTSDQMEGNQNYEEPFQENKKSNTFFDNDQRISHLTRMTSQSTQKSSLAASIANKYKRPQIPKLQ